MCSAALPHRLFRLLLAVPLLVGGFRSTHPLAAAEQPAAANVIHTCLDLMTASRETLATRPEVDLEAVVTFVQPSATLLFVHDGTAGVYVYTGVDLTPFATGTRIKIHGTGQLGLYAPIIAATKLTAAGQGQMPEPIPATVGRILSGALDSQWIEYTGVVHTDQPDWLDRLLQVYDGTRFLNVRVQGGDKINPPNLVDARIRVRGVAARIQDQDGFTRGFSIYVPGETNLEILEPPRGDPFAAPLIAVTNLGKWMVAKRQEHLFRISGVVNFQIPGKWLSVQDGEAALLVESTQTNTIAPGSGIEAVGFLAKYGRFPRMLNGTWRTNGADHPVAPRLIENVAQLSNLRPGQFVRIEGRLLNQPPPKVPPSAAIVQVSPLREVQVQMLDTSHVDQLQVGAEYRIDGVFAPLVDELEHTTAYDQIWVAGAPSFSLIRPAPAVTAGQHTTSALIGLALLSAILFGWWWQNRRQRIALNEMESALAFSRAQLVRAENETSRIARDLHDGVIQSIYAVGMRLEECRRLAGSRPDAAADKLANTSEALNHVIREVRGFLTGMEAASIQGKELKTALKSVLLDLGDEAANRIALDVDTRAAESLTSKEATELFHICKEAISNSLRHSHASRVEVLLQETRQGCRVEINDNGTGFDPTTVSAESRGLNNMRARAKTLGATLKLATASGTGTRIAVVLPEDRRTYESARFKTDSRRPD